MMTSSTMKNGSNRFYFDGQSILFQFWRLGDTAGQKMSFWVVARNFGIVCQWSSA